ncbi:UNVERIFIED_CONTAM: putative methylesterase 14, chloroplastic [Sesamum angustifolium]|uniref:Methylesterase 14, chloroplastic n=1 Tax=Sesamum angustifolium TaxID=2727405 RepID=A0AAW2IL28_9LAMI
MGNKFICMTKKDRKNGGIGSKGKRGSRRSSLDEELLHRQALAMAIQQHQLSQRFDNGSMSRRIGSTSSRRRPTNLSDPSSITNNKLDLELGVGIKTLLCLRIWTSSNCRGSNRVWYRSLSDINNVATLTEYSKPLIDFLEKLAEDEKVILVGHSSGGACISYALEHFPDKISKAVYVCATMISDGQRAFDVFAEELGSAQLFSSDSKSLIYGNGKDKPPTGFVFEKQHMHGLYFNQTPAKDVALAMVSMRGIPLGPMMEKMSLSAEKYGNGRRFYTSKRWMIARFHQMCKKSL